MLESLKVLKKMTPLQAPYNEAEIKRRIDEGIFIIAGDFLNPTTPGIKYAVSVIDNIIYAFKLSDSTNDKLVFVPEMAMWYDDYSWEGIWFYLGKRDFILADDDSMLTDVESYFGEEFSHEYAKKYYSNPENRTTICQIKDNRSDFEAFFKAMKN